MRSDVRHQSRQPKRRPVRKILMRITDAGGETAFDSGPYGIDPVVHHQIVDGASLQNSNEDVCSTKPASRHHTSQAVGDGVGIIVPASGAGGGKVNEAVVEGCTCIFGLARFRLDDWAR